MTRNQFNAILFDLRVRQKIDADSLLLMTKRDGTVVGSWHMVEDREGRGTDVLRIDTKQSGSIYITVKEIVSVRPYIRLDQ